MTNQFEATRLNRALSSIMHMAVLATSLLVFAYAFPRLALKIFLNPTIPPLLSTFVQLELVFIYVIALLLYVEVAIEN